MKSEKMYILRLEDNISNLAQRLLLYFKFQDAMAGLSDDCNIILHRLYTIFDVLEYEDEYDGEEYFPKIFKGYNELCAIVEMERDAHIRERDIFVDVDDFAKNYPDMFENYETNQKYLNVSLFEKIMEAFKYRINNLIEL